MEMPNKEYRKMKTKQSENGGTKMSKKMLVFVLIGCMSLVAAAWYFQVTGTSISEVLSPPGYRNVALEFEPMTLDVSNGSKCNVQYDYITINKDMLLNVTIKETIQDDSGGECLDYVNDCYTVYKIQNATNTNTTIVDKGTVNLVAMPNARPVIKEMCCEAYSCPQTRTSTLTLTQVA